MCALYFQLRLRSNFLIAKIGSWSLDPALKHLLIPWSNNLSALDRWSTSGHTQWLLPPHFLGVYPNTTPLLIRACSLLYSGDKRAISCLVKDIEYSTFLEASISIVLLLQHPEISCMHITFSYFIIHAYAFDIKCNDAACIWGEVMCPIIQDTPSPHPSRASVRRGLSCRAHPAAVGRGLDLMSAWGQSTVGLL